MKHVIAYSPPYGETYLKEFEVFSFMHSCGIDAVKLILSNSFSARGIPYSPYPLIWRGPGDYDFGVVDKQISDIVERNPDVRFIPMVDLNSPRWMREEMGKDSFNELGECYLDPQWLSCVEDYQEKLVAHLEKHYADRIFAYYIACGRTQEWFDHGWCSSSSPVRIARYREWCREKGRTPLPVPTTEEYMTWEGPVLPEHIVQWREFANTLTCDCALHFYRRIKKMVRPGVKLGCVFGNVHDIGSNGHFEAQRFCRDSGNDFYIGPSCNSDMLMGGASGFQSAQLMLRRHGVGYLHSCDRQLSTTVREIAPGIPTPSTGCHIRLPDTAADVACLKREFAIAVVHGFSLWFFNIWGEAYKGKEVRELFKVMGRLWPEYAPRSTGSDAETLLVFSPEAGLRHPPTNQQVIVSLRRSTLPAANMPFTTATVDDLYEVDLSPYKVIVFLLVDYLKDADMQMIHERVCCDNRVVVWCNKPGIASEKGVDLNRMEKVCGLPYGKGDAQEKDFGTWRSCVISTREVCTPERLHALGRKAGIHFFIEDADLKVWSSKEFLSAHTEKGGTKTIKLKNRACRVTEIFSGQVIAENTDCFTDEFAAPDTKLYYIEQ